MKNMKDVTRFIRYSIKCVTAHRNKLGNMNNIKLEQITGKQSANIVHGSDMSPMSSLASPSTRRACHKHRIPLNKNRDIADSSSPIYYRIYSKFK